MQIAVNILIAILVLVAFLLVLLVLMQRPKNEGLGAAFGGGVTENIFGGQTSNVLSRFTTYLAITFFGLTFLIAVLYARIETNKSATQRELLKEKAPAPVAAQSPAPAAAETPASAVTETPAPVETPAAAVVDGGTAAPGQPAPAAPQPSPAAP